MKDCKVCASDADLDIELSSKANGVPKFRVACTNEVHAPRPIVGDWRPSEAEAKSSWDWQMGHVDAT